MRLLARLLGTTWLASPRRFTPSWPSRPPRSSSRSVRLPVPSVGEYGLELRFRERVRALRSHHLGKLLSLNINSSSYLIYVIVTRARGDSHGINQVSEIT